MHQAIEWAVPVPEPIAFATLIGRPKLSRYASLELAQGMPDRDKLQGRVKPIPRPQSEWPVVATVPSAQLTPERLAELFPEEAGNGLVWETTPSGPPIDQAEIENLRAETTEPENADEEITYEQMVQILGNKESIARCVQALLEAEGSSGRQYTKQSRRSLEEMLEQHDGVCNKWYSEVQDGIITIRHRKGDKPTWTIQPLRDARHTIGVGLETMLAGGDVWEPEAEMAAVRKLGTLVNEPQMCSYFYVGWFCERSARSGVTYIFRRARPTIAIKQVPCKDEQGKEDVHFLASLCFHGGGYYRGTWAGVLVPTDDVIAALLLMRGDERRLWAKSYQHPFWDPLGGI